MFMPGRYITKEDREKIRKEKKKEREFYGYLVDAIDRMSPKTTEYKLKTYKERF